MLQPCCTPLYRTLITHMLVYLQRLRWILVGMHHIQLLSLHWYICICSRFFTPISNGQYGNCYIFNEAKSKRFSATSVGPTGGRYMYVEVEVCARVCVGGWVVVCVKARIDGLVQERRNSSALAMELRLSCTNPSALVLRLSWTNSLVCVFAWMSWNVGERHFY